MKLSNIVPTEYITQYSGDFIMALANYIDPEVVNDYEQAIIDSKLPVVLDNGAFETGFPDGIDNLLRKGRRLQPKYIFAPDNLFDAKRTRSGFENFEYIKAKQKLSFRTAVVVQASSEEEYLEEFKRYNADPRVGVIGLSYLAISYSLHKHLKKDSWSVFVDPDYTQDRIKMLAKIQALGVPLKPCHVLGLGKSFEDVKLANEKYLWCRYNDTSTCYMAAKKGLELNNGEVPGGKIKEKINIKDEKTPAVEKLLKSNIVKMQTYVASQS